MQRFLTVLSKFLRKPSFLAFVYFTVLTIVMTYPLVFHIRDYAPGSSGDGIYFIWLVRWYQKAFFELRISPFFNPFLNFPQGWYLASTDTTPAMVMLALPGSILLGPTFGYNSAMLLSFILSGWGMYLWVRRMTENELAGVIAGTIYAFLPFHMAHFIIGHLSLSGMQWFPFYFWGLYDLLKQEKFSWKPVLMASISAGLIGLTSPYYVYMTVLISVVFVLGFILFEGYKRLSKPAFWKSLLVFGLISAVLVGAAMFPYFGLSGQGGLATRPVEYLSNNSASPTDFVIPSIKHFLWGSWIDDRFSPEYWQESTLYIGAVAFVLGVIGFFKRRQFSRPQIFSIAILVAGVAFVLALGIDLHWLGRKITALPRFLQPIFHRTDMPQVYLPAYYLYKYLPFFSKMRVMMRIGVFTLIFTSLMAGLGAHLILKSYSSSVRKWIAVGLLILVFVDFYPGAIRDYGKVEARPVDTWLASQPDRGAVAQFPFDEESQQSQVYYTLVHQKPFIGGFFNANTPEQYTRIQPVMDEFPSQASVELLKQLGVAYVLVDSDRYADFSTVDQTIQSLGLQLLHVSGSQYVYRFP